MMLKNQRITYFWNTLTQKLLQNPTEAPTCLRKYQKLREAPQAQIAKWTCASQKNHKVSYAGAKADYVESVQVQMS